MGKRGTIKTYNYMCGYNCREKFLPISVTGNSCSLRCRHCNGVYLRHMIGITSAEGLISICERLKQKGGYGFLLSGGCDSEGRVPLLSFLPVIKKIKLEYDLYINVHPGLADKNYIKQIASAGPDMVSVDIIGDNNTIREVYNLSKTVDDYRDMLYYLGKYQVNTTPHITIGLHGGKILGEYNALSIVEEEGYDSVVLLVFVPTPGTYYGDKTPPDLSSVKKLFRYARERFDSVSLGCMKPHGIYRQKLEKIAVELGFDRIAQPSFAVKKMMDDMGIDVEQKTGCCVM